MSTTSPKAVESPATRRSLRRVVGRWLCNHGRHLWLHTTRNSKTARYYLRSCGRCNLQQIQAAGFSGDGKWHNTEGYEWKWGWEKADYDAANGGAIR